VCGSDLSFGSDSSGSRGRARAVNAMAARGQALVDTPRPEGGYPLEWHVQAMFVGDLSALAGAAARASQAGPGPPVSGR
jgi:hypothetical protein